jgi:hypothetical protein
MAKYTVRTEQVDGGWVAWVDQDNKICIRQENEPGLPGLFATQSAALVWGTEHAAELEANYEATLAAEARKKELEDTQHNANLAMIEQSKALAAILEKLTNPSA